MRRGAHRLKEVLVEQMLVSRLLKQSAIIDGETKNEIFHIGKA